MVKTTIRMILSWALTAFFALATVAHLVAAIFLLFAPSGDWPEATSVLWFDFLYGLPFVLLFATYSLVIAFARQREGISPNPELKWPFRSLLVAITSMLLLWAAHASADAGRNPEHGFPHFALQSPVEDLASAKTHEVRFDVDYRSPRYRIWLRFEEAHPDSLKIQSELVRGCIVDLTTRITAGDQVVFSRLINRDTGYSILTNEELSTSLAYGVTLRIDTDYRIDVEAPNFTRACQAMKPVLFLGTAPAPSL